MLCHGWPELAFSWRHTRCLPSSGAGYHVIVPNQRGYGNSSRPPEVTDYDIEHLSGDLVALLDHYEYEDATFVGHDWGAFVVWGLTLLHPDRVNRVINLSLPYQERGEQPWIEFMEAVLRRRLLLCPLQSTAGSRGRRIGRQHIPVPSQPVPEERTPATANLNQVWR